MLGIIVMFLIRLSLVALFLPFSALDKLLNTRATVDDAMATVHSRALARVLIGTGFLIEVVLSLAILSGCMDRLAAVIFAGYCGVTALLWKQFWKTPDFRLKGPSKGRDLFWDFMKNIALAGGFLILATGGTAQGVRYLLAHPLASSHPYATTSAYPSIQPANPSAGVVP